MRGHIAQHGICKDFYTETQIQAWLEGRSPEGYYEGINNGEMYVLLLGYSPSSKKSKIDTITVKITLFLCFFTFILTKE